MKMDIKKIEVDHDIYPRQKFSQKTVKSYTEALEVGADFPPITVQRVKVDGDEKVIAIDGAHRMMAFQEAGRKDIRVKYWKDKVLDKSENLRRLRVEAISRNLKHGDRLSQSDKKEVCRQMAKEDQKMEMSEQEFADIFQVAQQTIHNWINDIRAQQKGSRNSLIYRLSLLGWAQQDIADVVATDQSVVSRIMQNTNFGKMHNEYQGGKSVEDIAEYYGLDLQTTWAMVLKNKDDLERLITLDNASEGLSCKPRPYDVWNFNGCHQLFGYKYDGRIPGQIILQLLYFYTNQEELVVDPMAGSGTTVDACLLMNRKCLAYDVSPTCAEKRGGTQQADAIEAIKNLEKEPSLIFLDPPYFKKKEEEYGQDSISALQRNKYLDYFSQLAKNCIEKTAGGGRVALLMSDYTEDDPNQSIFLHHYIERFEEEGFVTERVIQCPLSTQQVHPDIHNKFVQQCRQARIARNLVVFYAPESE